MRKLFLAAAVAGATLGMPAGAAFAAVSTTQPLPAAACNSGTANAHAHAPETTGTGAPNKAHGAIPGTENVTPCGHGG
jgi:hypothetical protein